MDNVFSFPEKKQEEKVLTLPELQAEKVHLSRQMLDLIRAKNDVLARFNSDTQRLSMEMVEVVSRQNVIDEQMSKALGGVK